MADIQQTTTHEETVTNSVSVTQEMPHRAAVVTNAHLRDLLVVQSERTNGMERRLDSHIAEDTRRHIADRDYLDKMSETFEAKIAVAITTHLAPFTDILPSVREMVEERKQRAARDLELKEQIASLRAWLSSVVKAGGALATIATAVLAVGKVFHWW